MTARSYPPVADRFWAKVDRKTPEECWLWLGSRTPKRYGTLSVAGKMRSAHRVSWELHNGPVTEGLWVLHKCDTPSCVNPAHLYLGDHRTNMDDMARKGRQGLKLTPDQVRTIYRRAWAGGELQADIAKDFGVQEQTVSYIKIGRTWSALLRADLDASKERTL